MRIISFTGPKGSGKDTCADLLKAEGVSLGKISFAGPMRKMFCEIFELDPILFNDRDLKEYPFDTPIELNCMVLIRLLTYMDDYIETSDEDKERNLNIMISEGLKKHVVTTPRELLQYVGTEIIRKHINPAWHIEAAFSAKGLEGLDPEGIYCVTDARFPNEYLWLSKRFMLDFSGFYVERPEAEEMLKTATHDSELQVKEVRKLMVPGQIIQNTGSLKDLKSKVVGIL
jgi:hypothetical protein